MKKAMGLLPTRKCSTVWNPVWLIFLSFPSVGRQSLKLALKKFSASSYFGKKLSSWRTRFDDVITDQFHKWKASCTWGRRHPSTGTCVAKATETKETEAKADEPPSQTQTMALTPVSILWSLLSIFVASTCTVTFFYPAWVTHPDRLHSFGVFRYCVRNLEILIPTPRCISYGGNPTLGRIPAGAWQASCILYGGGCILMCVSALLTVLVLCVDKRKHRRLALINGYLQTVAGKTTAKCSNLIWVLFSNTWPVYSINIIRKQWPIPLTVLATWNQIIQTKLYPSAGINVSISINCQCMLTLTQKHCLNFSQETKCNVKSTPKWTTGFEPSSPWTLTNITSFSG